MKRFCEESETSATKRSINEKNIECKYCASKFSRLDARLRHEKSCEKKLNSEESMTPTATLKNCNYCNKIFSRLDAKVRHQKNCLMNPEKPTTSKAALQNTTGD
jgi:uncharacterized Zn-finger protein